MPVTPGEYEIEPNGKPGRVRVVNTVTGKVHAEDTNKDAAEHQKRLLYAVGHGWKPTEDQ